MKKRKNITAKVVAGIALGAIILSVIGTGILFVVSSFSSQNSTEISQEELQKLLETLPEAEVENSFSGDLLDSEK